MRTDTIQHQYRKVILLYFAVFNTLILIFFKFNGLQRISFEYNNKKLHKTKYINLNTEEIYLHGVSNIAQIKFKKVARNMFGW